MEFSILSKKKLRFLIGGGAHFSIFSQKESLAHKKNVSGSETNPTLLVEHRIDYLIVFT
jgi:hypothetical protein